MIGGPQKKEDHSKDRALKKVDLFDEINWNMFLLRDEFLWISDTLSHSAFMERAPEDAI